MATTSEGLPLLDGSEPGSLRALLNNLTNAINAALINAKPSQATASAKGIVELATQAEVSAGTDAERAVTPATMRGVGPIMRRGTAAQRGSTPAQFGDIWYDTDGNKFAWKGATGGTWRRLSGIVTDSAKAWNTVSDGNAGRTIALTIPTTLEASETLELTLLSGGTGFAFIGGTSITKNASNTTATIRFMQIMNTATQPCTVTWRIIDSGS